VAWGDGPGRDLPPDWLKRVAAVKRRAKRSSKLGIEQCEKRLPSGKRCPRVGKEVDHKIHRDNHEVWALQLLCPAHHKPKTQKEAQAGRLRAKKRIDPRDGHPGRNLR
jgi:5-methylcytosine-specific restriction endonuclease McrA